MRASLTVCAEVGDAIYQYALPSAPATLWSSSTPQATRAPMLLAGLVGLVTTALLRLSTG
ncbi:hypothetical protein [Fodinicola feengrottensis]|uniref:Uncharacterized protein n=1 Tax=Fodinicola feengrottensis TaxID=435914 RepID=A0ABP4VE38_9ACTN|nr:hypothetical protein [Fodinicola feengrottensis]